MLMAIIGLRNRVDKPIKLRAYPSEEIRRGLRGFRERRLQKLGAFKCPGFARPGMIEELIGALKWGNIWGNGFSFVSGDGELYGHGC